jgi:inorganic pyrophosphatase
MLLRKGGISGDFFSYFFITAADDTAEYRAGHDDDDVVVGAFAGNRVKYWPAFFTIHPMTNIEVVIETPKGSAQKYDYVPNTPFFKLKKILPSGMVFPYDFGFIPKTKGEDGDPLDVIVISEFYSFPGIIIKCRIIGGIKAEQSDDKERKKMIRNDRFLAIPKCSNIFQNILKMEDLPKPITDNLEAFFTEYNRLEGKKFKALKKMNPKEAQRLILKQLQ